MTEKQIIDTYCRIRTIDETIPYDVLDFMKDSAIEKLRSESEPIVIAPDFIVEHNRRWTNDLKY